MSTKTVCPICKGAGVTFVDYLGYPGCATKTCICQYETELLANVGKIWAGLTSAPKIENSPLFPVPKGSLLITARQDTLRKHLRFTALRKGPQWFARVVSDAELMQAWLATAVDIFDADVLAEREKLVHQEFLTLTDIAVPFDLLIIRVGVKVAKNREMPNVLLETIMLRQHAGKPTWIVDTPEERLTEGHIAYDRKLEAEIGRWPYLDLENPTKPVRAKKPVVVVATPPPFEPDPQLPVEAEKYDLNIQVFSNKANRGGSKAKR